MTEVWSHADDVSYMGPYGGIQRGWKQVRENLQRQADKKPGGQVTYENMQITADRNIAVVGSQIVGETFVNGDRVPVSIRATSTFRKEEGQWKMTGHHTDMLEAKSIHAPGAASTESLGGFVRDFF